ncbi:hypothetical protein [Youngiibacter fragilis]|uniref:Uncharacterized protein n=1 Tax=Youngiibacter fragilis 232.1 TaxID=994573 RepID=V7HZZ1_9CLOT|nr:hypothetical protein [Youngiibacter fragilis]ETA79188.1 hypothetical protein T472_0218465 [Youngiibacter fragilis 232.1]
MNRETLFESISMLDEDILERSENKKRRNSGRIIITLGTMAACLALIFTLALPSINKPLESASMPAAFQSGIAKYIESPPTDLPFTKADLMWLSQEDIFNKWNTAIFSGTVTKLNNIVISFKGDKAYRAIAEIKVDNIFRGAIDKGDTVSVLLPCPISGGMLMTGTEIISQLTLGSTGIFMPIEYDGSAYWEQNGYTLKLQDVAPYGLADGMRFAFLKSGDGILFARDMYPVISEAKTLEEIENYIRSMIK